MVNLTSTKHHNVIFSSAAKDPSQLIDNSQPAARRTYLGCKLILGLLHNTRPLKAAELNFLVVQGRVRRLHFRLCASPRQTCDGKRVGRWNPRGTQSK